MQNGKSFPIKGKYYKTKTTTRPRPKTKTSTSRAEANHAQASPETVNKQGRI
jgi:hypothetical protein